MIKAEELRIGNTVLGATGEHQQVAYITECVGLHNNIGGTDKYQKDPIFSYDINDLQPIPLTGQILEQYGFKNTSYTKENYIGFKLMLDEYRFLHIDRLNKTFVCLINDDVTLNRMHYLHELQNLYYALTGTELNPLPNR
jgi:hypothetical protein